MGLELLWSIVAIVTGTYVFIFVFLRKINEWYFVSMLGKKQKPLPPGDMGWPFVGNMFSFLKAFNSQDPDSFIANLIKWSVSHLSLPYNILNLFSTAV